VSECDREASTMKRLWLTGGYGAMNKTYHTNFLNDITFLVSVVENLHIYCETRIEWGTRWRTRLRYCAASRKFAGSIPDGVAGNFSLILSLRSPRGPGVDSAHNRIEYQEYFLGGKGGRCVGLTILTPSCADCLEMLDPSGPVEPCNVIALPFTFFTK